MSFGSFASCRRSMLLVSGAGVALVLLTAGHAGAACNLIPQAQILFRGALGSVDRPYAAPGDLVDLDVRSTLCDGTSTGFTAAPGNHVVTLVFEPLGNGTRRAVVLTTAPCGDLATELTNCGTFAKGG